MQLHAEQEGHSGFGKLLTPDQTRLQEIVMERFLSLKMGRVWHRQYANHDKARRDTSLIIMPASMQRWDIRYPISMNGR